jgi:hypothetical protein
MSCCDLRNYPNYGAVPHATHGRALIHRVKGFFVSGYEAGSVLRGVLGETPRKEGN